MWSVVACLLLGLLAACCCSAAGDEGERLYSNSWAVELVGGDIAADELAARHGFVNLGRVGSLEGVYHFRHEATPRRTRRGVQHASLAGETTVLLVEQQEVKVRSKRGYEPPTDAKWSSQWYLHRSNGHHMNVERAWEQDIIGRGSVVSILDDGIEYTHDDLRENYDSEASYDFNDHDADPIPRYERTNENKHGTRCAGEVAANRNGRCGVGAAYGSRVGGVRMLDGDITDVVEASSLSLNPQHIDIYSSSWGPSDDGTTVDGPGRLAKQAFLDGVTRGRGGLGSLFVWAAGNGGRFQDSCNCDGYAVSPYTISVGSASEQDQMPWYAERCSSTLAATYSSGGAAEKQIMTTDLHNVCTAHHTGTSAAAPLAAGILALALEANRNLTWRDMQYCVVYSSNPAFPQDDDWESNAAGLRVSHRYGFGIIDATALVNRARHWTTVPPQESCVFNITLNSAVVATSQHTLSIPIHTPGCTLLYLEHAQAIVTISLDGHGVRGALNIKLISPQGTTSTLLEYRQHDNHHNGFHRWPFMTVHSWGEDPRGDWSLSVAIKPGTEATVEFLSLVLYGTSTVPDAVHRIPQECHEQCDGRCSQAGAAFCDQCRHVRIASTLECVSSCPAGTYQHLHMCHACPQLCETCDSASSCSECVSGAVKLQSSLCAEACPELTFIDEDDSCQPCHHSCLKCNGPGEKSCTDCPGQWQLSEEGACVIRESCPEGSYMDQRVLECRSCHSSCAECSGKDSDSCTNCFPDFALQDGKCVGDIRELRSCNSSQYFDDQETICVPCAEGCANCSDEITCTTCDAGYFMSTVRIRESEEEKQVCMQDCFRGFFGDAESQTCQPCPSYCETCTAFNNCSSCSFNHSAPFQGQCPQPCHDGSYFNFSSDQCQLCMANCIECTSGDACLQCESDFFITPSQLCVSACPQHTVANMQDHVCLDARCHETCLTCFGPEPDQCISCDDEVAIFHENTCLESCPDHTFFNKSSCVHCHESCATCVGPDHDNCLSCPPGSPYLDHFECVSQCPPGSLASHEGECLACPLDCLHCSSTAECDTCQKGFVLLASNGSCIAHCPTSGHVVIDAVCRSCPDHCDACSTTDTCSMCAKGYSYYSPNKSCMSPCPEGYFPGSNGVCSECHFPCNTCTGLDQCLVCARDHAMVADSSQCTACCDPDKTEQELCCDCDANEKECVLKMAQHLSPGDNNNNGGGSVEGASTKYILGPVLVVLIVAAVASVLAMVGYRYFKGRHAGGRYNILPAVDRLEVADDSGSEAEIFTAEMDG